MKVHEHRAMHQMFPETILSKYVMAMVRQGPYENDFSPGRCTYFWPLEMTLPVTYYRMQIYVSLA